MENKYLNFKDPPESYCISSNEDTNYPTSSEDLDIDLLIITGTLKIYISLLDFKSGE